MNNILIDCERTKYPNTGLFQFCLELGNELIKLHDPLKEKLFFYLPEQQKNMFSRQQLVKQRHWHKFFMPGTSKFDIWHCTFQSSNYLRPGRKTKVVLTINDLNFLIEQKDNSELIKKHLAHVQKNVDKADHLVCISAFTMKKVQEHLTIGSKPIEVIYDGCDIQEFPNFNEPVYRPSRKFIFSIGTVLPKKNFHVLPCLLQHNDYELVISGVINKEYEQKIMEAAQLHGVADRVKLTGPVSGQDRYWYYKNCFAFAFPSLAEGFGLPLVEAMYFGKPCFISTHTSLPELGGDAVYYFEDFEPTHMQQVFEKGLQHYQQNNPAEYIRERALQFNWHNTGSSYLSIYRNLSP